jgi:hypothetical protein
LHPRSGKSLRIGARAAVSGQTKADLFLIHVRKNTQLFSKQEMESVLDDMSEEMRTTFRDELEVFYRMSGVFI